MKKQKIIQSQRLILRPFKMADSRRVQKLAGDPHISKTAISVPYPYPDGLAEAWISGHEDDFNKDKSVIYAIVEKDTNVLIGAISLMIEREHSKAELGYWIGHPYWGMGYGTEASKAMIKLGFEELNLNKIFAKAFDWNVGSWKIMEKSGMIYECSLIQDLISKGLAIDLKRYYILREDYYKKI